MKPRLVVIVKGGLIKHIFSNVYAEVLILDCDVEGSYPMKEIRDWDFNKGEPSEESFKAFDTESFETFVDPEAVNHYFSEIEKDGAGLEDEK